MLRQRTWSSYVAAVRRCLQVPTRLGMTKAHAGKVHTAGDVQGVEVAVHMVESHSPGYVAGRSQAAILQPQRPRKLTAVQLILCMHLKLWTSEIDDTAAARRLLYFSVKCDPTTSTRYQITGLQ